MGRFASAILAISCLSFLLPFECAHADSKLETVQLALNWKPEPQFGGFYAAEVSGFYKKHGLNVEVVPGGAGTPVVQMVATGQMDFGIASADEVVMARSNGADVVALFAAYQTNPQGIMTHAERGFKNLGDVFASEGVLAMQKGLPYAMYLMKKFGKPKVQIVPYLGGISNFLADKKFSQQCFVTSEPLAAPKKGATPKTFLVAEEGYNPYTTVLITRSEVVKKRQKLVKQLVESVREGWREYLDHPEKANQKMAELNKAMDLNTFVESAQAQKSLIETNETRKSGLGTMTKQRWDELAHQLKDLGVIKTVPASRDLFTLL